MNLRFCGLAYFPVTANRQPPRNEPVFKARYRSALLAEVQQHRNQSTKPDIQSCYTLFTLPCDLPYETLLLRELLVIVALYRLTYRSRDSFVLEITKERLAKLSGLSKQKTALAMKELATKKLIQYENLKAGRIPAERCTRIELCDPAQTGKTLREMVTQAVEMFESRPTHEWYSLLVYGVPGKVAPPKFYDHLDGDYSKVQHACTSKHPCPLQRGQNACNGTVNKDCNKFAITFFKAPDEHGHLDRWHCFRCGQGGDCASFWRRRWPKVQRQIERGRVFVGMPQKSERQKEWEAFE
jgi:hypothetical protein